MIFLAADHAGFELKERIKQYLANRRIIFEDFGTFSTKAVDYPPLAKKVAQAVAKHEGTGILCCGSGAGMAIVANRFKGIRSVVAWSTAVAAEEREDNDANVLSLPARFVSVDLALKIISTFLSTSFSHEPRHQRRLKEIDA